LILLVSLSCRTPSTKFGAHASEAIQELLLNQALLSEYLPNFNCP